MKNERFLEFPGSDLLRFVLRAVENRGDRVLCKTSGKKIGFSWKVVQFSMTWC